MRHKPAFSQEVLVAHLRQVIEKRTHWVLLPAAESSVTLVQRVLERHYSGCGTTLEDPALLLGCETDAGLLAVVILDRRFCGPLELAAALCGPGEGSKAKEMSGMLQQAVVVPIAPSEAEAARVTARWWLLIGEE